MGAQTVGAWGVELALDSAMEVWPKGQSGTHRIGSQCMPYDPSLQTFCAGHDHPLPCDWMLNPGPGASLLARAKNTYTSLMHADMQNLTQSHPECSATLRDAICLDFFPVCSSNCKALTLTPCKLACQNLRKCAKATGHDLKADCEAKCKESVKCTTDEVESNGVSRVMVTAEEEIETSGASNMMAAVAVLIIFVCSW